MALPGDDDILTEGSSDVAFDVSRIGRSAGSPRRHDGIMTMPDDPLAGEPDRWRDVVGQRLRHHNTAFHSDYRKTKTAVELLDSLVGGARRTQASDEPVEAGIRELSHDADRESRIQQLRQLRAVSDSVQLAIDILRARETLGAAHRPKSLRPTGAADESTNAAARRSGGSVDTAASFALQSVFHPWHHDSHSDAEVNSLFFLERASDLRLERAQKAVRRFLHLTRDAPVAELSQAIRATTARNIELEREIAVLRREEVDLAAQVAQADAEMDGLAGPSFLADPNCVWLPRDSREWCDWADQLATLGRSGAPGFDESGSSAPAAASPASRRGRSSPQPRVAASPQGQAESIFHGSVDNYADIAWELPEVQAWAEEVSDAFGGSLGALSAMLQSSHSSA